MELSNKGKDATKRGTVQQAHLFHTQTRQARIYSHTEAIEELQPNKQLFTAQSLTQFYLQDTAPQHPYKNPKRK